MTTSAKTLQILRMFGHRAGEATYSLNGLRDRVETLLDLPLLDMVLSDHSNVEMVIWDRRSVGSIVTVSEGAVRLALEGGEELDGLPILDARVDGSGHLYVASVRKEGILNWRAVEWTGTGFLTQGIIHPEIARMLPQYGVVTPDVVDMGKTIKP